MPSSVQKPGTSTDEMMSSRYSVGIDDQISRKRWKMRSIQPAEIALHRARGDADDGRDDGERAGRTAREMRKP